MKKLKKGFTIVELVIVIAVIGILSAILIPTFTNATSKAQTVADQANLRNAYTAYLEDTNASTADVVLATEDTVIEEDVPSTTATVYVLQNDGKWASQSKTGTFTLEGTYLGYNVYVVVEA